MLAALLTMLAFHLWQLLALPAAAVVALLLWRWWRGGRDRTWLVALSLAACLVACAPLARVTASAAVPAGAHGARVRATGGTRWAWPSLTWTAGPRPYATGRGAEAVALSPVPHSWLMSTARAQWVSARYTVTEVG